MEFLAITATLHFTTVNQDRRNHCSNSIDLSQSTAALLANVGIMTPIELEG